MLVIGLCGGSGSGKSTAADIFTHYNILPINADLIYRELTSKKTDCLIELVNEFGESILDENGVLDRKSLGAIVYRDEKKLKRLNSITHFHILASIRAIINDVKSKGYFAVLVDAPLLFESGFDKECDFTIAVIADEKTRVDRIVSRDKISESDAIRRISYQLSNSYLQKNCDYVIYNNSTLDALVKNVNDIVNDIKNKIK